MLTVDAATIQPARLARALRRVCLELGVRVFEGTPASRFRADPPPEAETPGGRVRAGAAILALNAWAARWRAFRSRLAVRGTYMVVTAPAPERLEEIGWTGGEAVWNFRSAVNYLRTTPDGRIAFGTGGMQPGLARAIGPRFTYEERFVAAVAGQLRRMFPSFRDVPLEEAWGGPIDVSGSHLPFVGTLPGGCVHYGLGYTGNGVGPSHLVGRILASLALGEEDERTRLPIVGHRPPWFPPDPFRSAGSFMVNAAILRKDAAEDAGRRANPAVTFAATLPRRLGYRLGP
jgi:glycine/D-amino acid oxidase-like deaminating enzyme